MPGAPESQVGGSDPLHQQVMPAQFRSDAQEDITAREGRDGQAADEQPRRLVASYGTMPDGADAVSANGGGASTEVPAVAQAPAGPQQDSTMMSTTVEQRESCYLEENLRREPMLQARLDS